MLNPNKYLSRNILFVYYLKQISFSTYFQNLYKKSSWRKKRPITCREVVICYLDCVTSIESTFSLLAIANIMSPSLSDCAQSHIRFTHCPSFFQNCDFHKRNQKCSESQNLSLIWFDLEQCALLVWKYFWYKCNPRTDWLTNLWALILKRVTIWTINLYCSFLDN